MRVILLEKLENLIDFRFLHVYFQKKEYYTYFKNLSNYKKDTNDRR